jgi:hypothetical protein
MSFSTLSIDLVAQMARFSADLGRAASVSEKTGRQIAASMGIAKSALEGLAAGLTLSGLVLFAKRTIDSVDRLNDLKDSTGASIEKLSGLEDIAARTGSSFENLQDALLKSQMALKDSKPGSDQEAAIKALGLSVEELKKLDPADALLEIAKAMGKFSDSGDKSRLSLTLFGRSLKETAPLLKDLAESGELVVKVTTAQAEEAEKFNKQLFAMQKNVQDVSRYLLGDMVTAINAAGKAMRESGLLTGLRVLFGGDEEFKRNEKLIDLTNDLLKFEAQAAKFRGIDNAFARGLTKGAEQKAEIIRKEIANLQQLRNVTNPDNQSAAETARLLGRRTLDFNPTGKPNKPKKEEITDSQRELARYVDGLQSAIEKTQDLTEQERALNFLRSLGTAGQVPQVRERVLGLAVQIDKERELVEIRKRDLSIGVERNRLAGELAEANAKRTADELQALQNIDDIRKSQLDGLLSATPSAQLEQSRADILLLTEEFQKFIDTAGKAGISEQVYLEAVSERLGLTSKALEKTKSIAEELGLTFESAFEDAVLGGKKLSDVLKGLAQDFARIVLRQTVTKPLADMATKFIGTLFSADGGGYTGNGSRTGGMDGKGGFMAMLHPQETVIDHTKGQRGGSVVINMTPQIGDVASMSYVQEAVARGVQQALAAARRNEGYT